MSFRRHLIRALDRPIARKLLAWSATRYAHKLGHRDIDIFYDDVWLHRYGNHYFGDSAEFRYFSNSFQKFAERAAGTFHGCEEFWFHLYKPAQGDVIVDVGAGDGGDTLPFSECVGTEGRVIAIEAHPNTFRLLKAMCKWNKLDNVTLCNEAVVDAPGDVFIEDNDAHYSNSVIKVAKNGSHALRVPGVTLDQLCERDGVTRIDLLKMNIEGAEQWAINGMHECIKRTRYAVIACHDFRASESERFCTKEIVVDFLEKNDFEICLRRDDPRAFVQDHVHARNKRLSGILP